MLDLAPMKLLNSPKSAARFSDMNLEPLLLKALERMNISRPTPVQSQAIPTSLDGSDLIAVAQTGSGKTLAFALAMLTTMARKPEARGLVLVPSREMAQQIYKVFLDLCQELSVSVCLLIGGGGTTSKQANQLKKNPRLIIATPGRLNDHLRSNRLLLQKVETIVLDEADRMLDMGFAPQLREIQHTLRGPRQTMMFSASFSKQVEEMAAIFMKPQAYMIRTEQAEAPVTSLKQQVLFMDRSMKNDRLLDDLNARKGGVIVFTGNKEVCESVGTYLKEYGFAVDLIHGDLSQGQRNRVMRSFRESTIRIIVATDLLARGLDVPHVDHVINYDLPFQAEDFLHRIGRTARAGRTGHAITYVTPSDTRMYAKIKGYLAGAEEFKVDPTFQFIDRRKKLDKRKKEDGKKATPAASSVKKRKINPKAGKSVDPRARLKR